MKTPIICVFLRSFFLQSVWNYERMQNVGFVFTIIPWLKKIYDRTQKFYERIKIHYGFFNTHPYLANVLIGIIMKLEEQYSKNEITNEDVLKTKTLLAGPIAAIGDRLIWSTWRVFCSIVAVGYFLSYGRNFYNEANVWVGIIGYLVLYNIIGHIPIRFLGLYFGYEYSKEIIERIAKFGLQKTVNIIRAISAVLLLIIAVFYSLSLLDNIFLVILFWVNLFLSLVLHKKIAAIYIVVLLLCINALVFFIFKL